MAEHPRRGLADVMRDPYGSTGRLLMYASGATVVLVCCIAAVHGGHWRWWLFAWGVADGFASAITYGLLLKLLPALLGLPADKAAQARPNSAA
jgi:hypothetical protein